MGSLPLAQGDKATIFICTLFMYYGILQKSTKSHIHVNTCTCTYVDIFTSNFANVSGLICALITKDILYLCEWVRQSASLDGTPRHIHVYIRKLVDRHVHTSTFLTCKHSYSKPLWAPSYFIPFPTIPLNS